jgi:hypothetical protein
VGKIIGYYYKGVLVDIPMAVNEGLRAVPRMYGEEVKSYDNIKDFKSGAAAARENFTDGMTGVSELLRQPYKGAQEDGFRGMVKGFVKGPLSMGTKASSGISFTPLFLLPCYHKNDTNASGSAAALGLVAYPGQGLVKSIHTAMHGKTRRLISKARLKEGQYLAIQSSKAWSNCPAVLEAFEAQQRQPGAEISGFERIRD